LGNYLQGRDIRGRNEKTKEGQKGSYIIGKIHKGKKDLNDERQKEDKRKKYSRIGRNRRKTCEDTKHNTRNIESREETFNPLTPELNPSTQRCLTRFFTGDFAS
jgi:hypothetical protein